MGLGLGGLVDGIVIHQVLQWHHMVSATEGNPLTTVEGLETNTLADGFFHVATVIVMLLGVAGSMAAWRRGCRAPTPLSLAGAVLAGWGIFNVLEGLVDHVVLGVHHVRDDLGGPASWDIGFLALGAVLVAAGTAMHQAGERRT